MRKQKLVFSTMLVLLAFTLVFTSCKKDETTPLTLSSMVAGSIDLNAATAPTNVPVSPTIVATFSTEIDPATAVSANITLTQDYDKANIPVTIAVDGKKITITPSSTLGNGALYRLAVTAALKAKNGEFIKAFERTFTTEGTFAPTGQIAYWSFEDNANDVVGNYDPSASGVIGITYTASRNAAAGKAATFNGTTSLIEIPNGDQLINTHDFTLAFWVKADSSKHGQFVMGLAGWYGTQFEIAGDYTWCKLAAQYDFGDGTSGSEDLWFPGNGQTKDNGGWQGWTFCKDLSTSGGVKGLLAAKWAHVVCTYNSATKVGTMYINGEKMKEQDFNLWPSGDKKKGVVGLKYAGAALNNTFVFGFIQDKTSPTIGDSWADYNVTTNNHFKGQLDDVRVFHKALSASEISLIYNSEKP